MMNKVQPQDTAFALKAHLPIEDAFMAAIEAVNHYMVEDTATGELYAHPLLRQAWTAKLFLQYYTDLAVDTITAEGRNALYVLLQWTMENKVFERDAAMQACYRCFVEMTHSIEETMLKRHAQRMGTGNQLRKLLNLIQLQDEHGNGGWDALRDVIAEHMLDEQHRQQAGNVVDMRLFGKMRGTEKH